MASQHDRAVLNSIFNPLLPIGIGDCVDGDDIPFGLQNTEEEDGSLEGQESRQLELEAVKKAEEGKLEEALQLLTKAIQLSSTRGSCYNNRAQILRLQDKIADAIIDLNNAINLSDGKGKAACQAYCQRAMIHRKQGREESATKDFQLAAKLGSTFAKAQLVQLNPYAAMCNKMLHDVMMKLRAGEGLEDREHSWEHRFSNLPFLLCINISI